MKDSVYHILLRTSALLVSIVLLFVSGVLSPLTQQLSENTGAYLANTIGMTASVTPTEINTLSAQLAQRDNELTQREIAIELKESSVNGGAISTFILSALLFILLVLILLNYVLDYIRSKDVVIPVRNNEQTA